MRQHDEVDEVLDAAAALASGVVGVHGCADLVGDLVGDRVEPVGVGDQWSAQVEPVGRLDHLRSSDGRWSDDDVDRDRFDLGVFIDVDAGEDAPPRGQSGLVLVETRRVGADQAEGEVITEVSVDQFGQRSLGFGEVGCP